MINRVPQLNDDVTIVVTLPVTTEEWAEELLTHLAVETERDEKGLHIAYTLGGNCNAITNAQSFLDDLQDALADGDVDPMEFTLRAWSVAPALDDTQERGDA